jgi:hypothetical protein
MAKRIVLHVGFMRTGSSFLQAKVLPGLSEVATYSYGHPFIPLAIGVRNATPGATLTAQRQALIDWVEASDRPIQLFSWEGLVGGFLADYRQFPAVTDFLKSTFPDAHVILFIRRQADLVDSLYRQALHTYHFPHVSEFLNRTSSGFGAFREGPSANIDVRSLAFGPVVDRYEAMFGADRVHIIPYELLRLDAGRFYCRLSKAIGATVPPVQGTELHNRGYSAASAGIARRLNRFFRTAHNPNGMIRPEALNLRAILQRGVDRLFYHKGELLPSEWREEIMALHAEDNRALDERRQLGLAALGYDS